MEYKDIIFEKKAHIACITINRPQVLNSVSEVTQEELNTALHDVQDDNNVWVAILTGAGNRAFCAGHDMKWQDSHPEEYKKRLELRKKRQRKVYSHQYAMHGGDLPPEIWKPLIAAVNGYAVGGGLEIALNCDMIIAAETASFGLPEVTHGWPPHAGNFLITRNVPLKIAMEILLIGDRISAQRAYEIGLVNKVVPADRLMETATAYAQRLCENPPLGVWAAKVLAMRGMDMPLNYAPLAWHLFSDSVNRMVQESEDRQEGRRAFAEKRKPVFTGR